MESANTDAPQLLIVDDKASMRSLLEATFAEKGYAILTASDGQEAIDRIGEQTFDIIITDLNMPEKNGIDVLKAAKTASEDTEVIVVTAFGTMETAVEAMRLGAYDFLAKPFQIAEIETKVRKIIDGKNGPSAQAFEHDMVVEGRAMVGNSINTQQVMKMIKKIGPSKSSVLIMGPTGTGKELVARALHQESPLREKPFVALRLAGQCAGTRERT